MKLIREIIDYLLDEDIITNEDFEYLQSKGYYKKSSPHYFVEFDDDDELEKQLSESIDTQKDLDLEESLEDNRRRKQGKRGRFYSGKSKKYGKRQTKKKLLYYYITDENIARLSNKIPRYIKSGIEQLKGKYYYSYRKFTEDLSANLQENKQDSFEKYSELIKNNISHTYKIPHYIKKEDGFYITPRTFTNMKKKSIIINTTGYELFILLPGDKKIQLTNKYGKIIHRISLKKY